MKKESQAPSNSPSNHWIVHKFGGTSVANAERYKHVAEIVGQSGKGQGRLGIVVSAMSGVTNALVELTRSAEAREDSYLEKLAALKERHLTTARELVAAQEARAALEARITSDFDDLRDLLRGVYLAKGASDRTAELVSGYGEIWSAQFLHAVLVSRGQSATWLDAREVLVVEPPSGLLPTCSVNWDESRGRMADWARAHSEPVVVITGFVASTPSGVTTTLGRNGSDYSASIFGALLQASAIHIWTDVDGVLSADPRLVPEAVVLKELSYAEATELAYFGAKVVHPSTMAPAIRHNIPLWIRNTFRPELPGTCIHLTASSTAAVKGFATIDGMALMNVEGTGMMGVPGVAQKVFGALREVGVSVVMISQASSESSICFAIPEKQASLASTTLEKTFFAELNQGHIQTISVTPNCSVLAVVGDNMVHHTGLSGKFFGALGRAGINVRAIAQGSSERNISTVIDAKETTRALRAVHSAFYLSHQTLAVGVVGAGLIGSTLLDQLSREEERLKSRESLELRVRGILTSKKMLLGDPFIPLARWRDELRQRGTAPDLARFVAHVGVDSLPHHVLVDATASNELPDRYPEWLARGFHLITPNKKGNAGRLERYRAITATARRHHRQYLYETTVGAGLPVINTLRDLIQTGDRVETIEGVFSGTLSYLFNSWTDGKAFSEIVREAKSLGFTEPDPRDDLSGTDVARKLVILAREMGEAIELDEIPVRNLVPERLTDAANVSTEEFLSRLKEHDAEMQRLRDEAERKAEVLRYVGRIEAGAGSPGASLSISLRSYPRSHPFAGLTATDNIVAYQTARYHTQPLIVRGPGAGPEVTAAGVFAELLRLAASLGGGA